MVTAEDYNVGSLAVSPKKLLKLKQLIEMQVELVDILIQKTLQENISAQTYLEMMV